LGSLLGADLWTTINAKQQRMAALRNHLGWNRWPKDIMRHSFASYYSVLVGSIGKTAIQMGNSEAIIKSNYKSKVSKSECKQFWALLPSTL